MAFRFLSIFLQKEKMDREQEPGLKTEQGIDAMGKSLSSMTEKQVEIDLEAGHGLSVGAVVAMIKNDAGTNGEKRALGEVENT